MTEQQALQKMKSDIQLRGLSESTFKNYTRNVKPNNELSSNTTDEGSQRPSRCADER